MKTLESVNNLLKPDDKEALDRAIELFGSASEMAKQLGYESGSMAIRQWQSRKSVPPRAAKKIEQLLNGQVTRAELCPDVFGDIA